MANNSSEYSSLLDFNPNILVYGATNTGKASTVKELIEAFESKNNSSSTFEQLKEQNRLKVVTFHSEYKYSDFVEGIKPYLEYHGKEKQLLYKLENGILKNFASLASLETIKTYTANKITSKITNNSKIWKVSLGYRKTEERIYRNCKRAKEICIGWLENEDLEGKSYEEIYYMLHSKRGNDEPKLTYDTTSINAVVSEMKKGDLVFIYDSQTTIKDIGVISGDYFYDYGDPYPHKRKVIWLKQFKKPFDITKYDKQTRLFLKTIYEIEELDFSDVREILGKVENKKSLKPFYLVLENLEQINFNNIFGELLSLLAKEKREKASSTLLHSKKDFSLPANLYLIATFLTENNFNSFNEIIKKEFLLVPAQLNLKESLTEELLALINNLNNNILTELGKEYIFSEGYFVNIKNIEDLKKLLIFKIKPLITLYCKGDFEKVSKILPEIWFL